MTPNLVETIKSLDDTVSAPTSCVFVWVDANYPDDGLGFLQDVSLGDAVRIVKLLKARVNAIENSLKGQCEQLTNEATQ